MLLLTRGVVQKLPTLADLIREYRDEHGLSLRDFAERCSLSHAYVDKLERAVDPRSGKPVTPTVETLRLLAQGMGVTLEDLMARVGYIPEKPELDPNISAIFRGVRELTPEVRQDVLDFVRWKRAQLAEKQREKEAPGGEADPGGRGPTKRS